MPTVLRHALAVALAAGLSDLLHRVGYEGAAARRRHAHRQPDGRHQRGRSRRSPRRRSPPDAGEDGPRPAAEGGRERSPPTSRLRGAPRRFLPNGDAVVTERDTPRVLLIGVVRRHGSVGSRHDRGSAAPGARPGCSASPSPPTVADRPDAVSSTSAPPRTTASSGPRCEDGRLGTPEPVLTGIPQGFRHDGGRLVFGPNGYLYVSTGEIGEPARSQDTRRTSAGRSCASPGRRAGAREPVRLRGVVLGTPQRPGPRPSSATGCGPRSSGT